MELKEDSKICNKSANVSHERSKKSENLDTRSKVKLIIRVVFNVSKVKITENLWSFVAQHTRLKVANVYNSSGS